MFKNSARVLESIAKEFIERKDKKYCQEILEILLKSYDTYFYKNKADDNLKEDRIQYKLQLADNLFKDPPDQLHQLFNDFIKEELNIVYREKLSELNKQNINTTEQQFLKQQFGINLTKQIKSWEQRQSMIACFLSSSEEINKFTNSLRKQFAEQFKKGSILVPSNTSRNQLHNTQPNPQVMVNYQQQNIPNGVRGEQIEKNNPQQISMAQNQQPNNPNNRVNTFPQQVPQTDKGTNLIGGNQLKPQTNRSNMTNQQSQQFSDLSKEGEVPLDGSKVVSQNKFSNIPIPSGFNPKAVGQIIQPVNSFIPNPMQKNITNSNGNNNNNNNNNINPNYEAQKQIKSNIFNSQGQEKNLTPRKAEGQGVIEGQQANNQIGKKETLENNPSQNINQLNLGNLAQLPKDEIVQGNVGTVMNPTDGASNLLEQRRLLSRKIKPKAVPEQVSFADLILFLSYPHIPEVYETEAKVIGLEIEDKYTDLQATQIIHPTTISEVNQTPKIPVSPSLQQNPQKRPSDTTKFTLFSNNQNQNAQKASTNQPLIEQNQLTTKNNAVISANSQNIQSNNNPTQKEEIQGNINWQASGNDAKEGVKIANQGIQIQQGIQQARYQEPPHNNSQQTQRSNTSNNNPNKVSENPVQMSDQINRNASNSLNRNKNNSNGNINMNPLRSNQDLNKQGNLTDQANNKMAGNTNHKMQNANGSNTRGSSQQVNGQFNLQANTQYTNIDQNNQFQMQTPQQQSKSQQPPQQYGQPNVDQQQKQQQIYQQQQQQRQNQMQPQQRQNRQNNEQQQGEKLQKQEIYYPQSNGITASTTQPINQQYGQQYVEGGHLSTSHGVLGNINQQISQKVALNANSQSQHYENYNQRQIQDRTNFSQSQNIQNQNINQKIPQKNEVFFNGINNFSNNVTQNQRINPVDQRREQLTNNNNNNIINNQRIANNETNNSIMNHNNQYVSSNQINVQTNHKGNQPNQERFVQQRQSNTNEHMSTNTQNTSSMNKNQGYQYDRQEYSSSRKPNQEQMYSANDKQQLLQQQQQQQQQRINTQSANFNVQKANNLGVSNYFDDQSNLQNNDYFQKDFQLGGQQEDFQQFDTPKGINPQTHSENNNGGIITESYQNNFEDSFNVENSYQHNLQNSQIRQSNLSLGGVGSLVDETSYPQTSQPQIIGDNNGYNSHNINEHPNTYQDQDSMIRSQPHQVNENFSMIESIPEFNINIDSTHQMSSDSKGTNMQIYNAPSFSSRAQTYLTVANPNDFAFQENNSFDNKMDQVIQSTVQTQDQYALKFNNQMNNNGFQQQEQMPLTGSTFVVAAGNTVHENFQSQMEFQNYAEPVPIDPQSNWQQQYNDGFTSQVINVPAREDDAFAFHQASDQGKNEFDSNTPQTNRQQPIGFDINSSKYEQTTPQGNQKGNGYNNMNISGVYSLSNSLKLNSNGEQSGVNQAYPQQQNYPTQNYLETQKPIRISSDHQLGNNFDNLQASNSNRIGMLESRGSNSGNNNGNVNFQNSSNNLGINSNNYPKYNNMDDQLNPSAQESFQSNQYAINQRSNGDNQFAKQQISSRNFLDYQQQPTQGNIINLQGVNYQPQPFQDSQESTMSSSNFNNRIKLPEQQIQQYGVGGSQITNNYGYVKSTISSSSNLSGNILYQNYQKTSNDKVQVYRQNQDIENDSPDFKIINAAFQCGQFSKEYQEQIRKDIKQFKQVKQNIILEVQESEQDPTSFYININDEKHKTYGSLKILVTPTQFKMVDFNYFKKAKDVLSGVNNSSKLIDLIKIWWKFEFAQENKKKNSQQNQQPPQFAY